MAAGGVVLEDAPHDLRFGFVDHKVRRGGRAAGHAAVAVGGLPGDDLTGAGAPQLAAPVALGDLGPFVLGDHALDLGEQAGLGVVVDGGGVGEAHHHAVAGQLVQHDHLVGVAAGEPVGRQAPHGLDQPGFGRVPQPVQPRAVQPRTRVAVVAELGDHLVTRIGGALSQRGKLGADRAAVVLALGGDPGVDTGVHGFASLASTRPPVAVRMNW